MRRNGRITVLIALGIWLIDSARAAEPPPDLFPSGEEPARPLRAPVNPSPLSGLGGLDNLFPGPGYSATWNPARAVRNQNAELGMVRQELSLLAPVWSEGGDLLFATANVKNVHTYTDALLPDTGRRFPRDLWNASIGLAYLHRFDNGWTGGGLVNVGSASDKPFKSFREMNVNFAGFLRVPTFEERDAWLFSLFYSPGGQLNFPIPGIAYQWNPSDRFHLTIGLPLAVMWKPTDDLTFNASYIPLTNIKANLDYRLTDELHVYGGYEFLNDSYFLADRVERRDRFLIFEQRVIGGLKFNVFETVNLDLNAGYSFGRYFGEGRNQGAELHDRIDLKPGPFLGASLRLKF